MEKSIIILAFALSSIVLNALADGYNDSNKKEIGHFFAFLSIFSFVLMPICYHIDTFEIVKYLVGYTFIRFGIFDLVYNITRDLDYYYIGNTSFVDKFLKLLKLHDSNFIFLRILTFITGIALIFKIV
ncbi:MAG: hypothetical protein HC892_01490 [Saprospiraceae bacterium]|nr:hypothetical protein [Saprospiraceae bacterium]